MPYYGRSWTARCTAAPTPAATLSTFICSTPWCPTGILKPEELFDKIDPDELVAELGEPLREAAEELVDTMMLSF